MFAHIERYLKLGMIHLEEPRVNYWYGSGSGNFHVEWIDQAQVWERTQVLHDTFWLCSSGFQWRGILEYRLISTTGSWSFHDCVTRMDLLNEDNVSPLVRGLRGE